MQNQESDSRFLGKIVKVEFHKVWFQKIAKVYSLSNIGNQKTGKFIPAKKN